MMKGDVNMRNDNIECCHDFPDNLKRFYKNMKDSTGCNVKSHNMYLLQTTDRDGNITGEAYGINLMTNNGFQKLYDTGSSFADSAIYIGNSTQIPTR